jgi:hypothetical protein
MANDKVIDRHVNIWINNKQVSYDVASMTSELNKMRNEWKRMTIGTQEWIDKGKEIQKVKKIVDDNNASLKKTPSFLDQIKGSFGYVTAAVGSAVAGWKIFKGVLDSTDTLSDRFNATMGGIKEVINSAAQSLANWSFKDFFKNLRDAVAEGKRYVETQDEIGDSARALTMEETRVAEEILKLKIIQADANKSKAEQIKAGEEIEIKMAGLADKRVTQETKAFNNEIDHAKFRSKLNKETILGILNQDKAYMDLYETGKKYSELESAINSATTSKAGLVLSTMFSGVPSKILVTKEAFDKMKETLASMGEEGEKAKQIYIGWGNVVEAQRDKIVQADKAVSEARKSATEDILRQINKTNTARAEEAAKAVGFNKQIIDSQNQLREENAKHMEKWIEDELGNLAKGEKNANDFKANIRKLLGVQEDSDSHARDEKWKAAQLARLAEIKDNNEKEKALNKEKIENYLAVSQQIGEALGQSIADGTLSAKEASKILIMTALDALGKFAIIAIAKTTVESLASPESIATMGIAGIAKAIILTALIETAVAAAKGVISKSLDTGGFTGSGGKHEPAGIVHKGEWVAPAWMLKSPTVGPSIEALEYIRTNNSPGYATGGGPGMNSAGYEGARSAAAIFGTDPELKALIRENIRINKILARDGVNMKFGYIQADNVKKGLDKLGNIEEKVSM